MSYMSNMLRRGGNSLDTERETFEKNQMLSVQKALNTAECAAKEKHIRNIILGTHQDKSGKTFWVYVKRMPISSQQIVAWKFCHVLHKVMRDGHPKALGDSIKYRRNVVELSTHWQHFSLGYGKIISLYLNALSARMDFHEKYESVPGSLNMSEELMEKMCGSDINAYFALCVDILECIETQLQLQQKVFSTLDMSRAVSLTGVGQCRLAPLILVILDTSKLYDSSVKVLFKLHASLPADVLTGHRERFNKCHHALKKFYHICANLQYFKRLLLIPTVNGIPDFFIVSDGTHELGPVQMVEDDHHSDRSPSPEPTIGQLIDTTVDDIFDDHPQTSFQAPPQPDPRDELIEAMTAEIKRLKQEIELMQFEHSDEVKKLLERLSMLQKDLNEAQALASSAAEATEEIKEKCKKSQKKLECAVKAQSLLGNVEKRASNSEELYRKLKEKHMNLVKEHAGLLRKNADTKKQAETYQQSAGSLESEKVAVTEELDVLKQKIQTDRDDNEALSEQVGELTKQLESQSEQSEKLKADLENQRLEAEVKLADLQKNIEIKSSEAEEKEELQKAEVTALQSKVDQEVKQYMLLKTELVSKEEESKKMREEAMRELINSAASESHSLISKALTSLDEEGSESRKCSAGTFLQIVGEAQTTTQRLDEHLITFQNEKKIDGVVKSLAAFGHWLASSIENGAATRNMASGLNSDLDVLCRSCAHQSLEFLSDLQSKDLEANSTLTKEKLREMTKAAQELLPRGSDVEGGDLHDVVEQEMAATTKAVEEAAERIEALLNEARERNSGVNLEVNERILDSCTDLMSHIQVLIVSSKDLQRECVDNSRGASSQKDFYMKNSRWTEGLISAAKAVGWGATMLTDAADNVIKGEGKFEELVVCSNEISASTAQLVAASRVKATKGSEKLLKLEKSSRDVNGSTGRVVASTNSGRKQLNDDGNTFADLVNQFSLTQIKRKEMDSKVRVLELEQALQDERIKLGALRKKHYDLAKDEEEEVEDPTPINGSGDASTKSTEKTI